jgi:class 3 adenylate cyclase
LDVDVAMKAAQAIGAEYEMTRLLQRLVEVTLEAAGAQRCVLALDEGLGLRVQAMGSVDSSSVQVLMGQAVADCPDVCEAIVQYAARTKRPLAIADARVDGRFEDNPYVRARLPLSILAMPLLRQGAVVGVLYLENNLAVGVFTSAKLKVLELVAAKLVIAIENVRLLEGQRVHARDLQTALHRVEVLQKAKAHLAKFVPQSVQRIIDDNPHAPALEKQSRDATVLFLDMAGYTKMTEALDPSRIDHLIERYFSAFLPDVLANGGDINETAGDGLMILFLDEDPNAHAIHAARTALAIRRRTNEINAEIAGSFDPVQINIGINSGRALVGSTKMEAAAGTRYAYTATGTVTNIAARIAAAATDGAILVSAETANRIGHRFVLQAAQEHRFKNVAAPVQVLRLDAEVGDNAATRT